MGFNWDLSEKEYKEIARANSELAKKIKHLVKEDTLIIYLDKSGRLVRVPLESALKKLGVKLPAKRYFMNPTGRKYLPEEADSKLMFSKSTEREVFKKELNQWLKKSGVGNFGNIIVIDEFAESGKSIYGIKKGLEEVTGKRVSTAVLSSDPYVFGQKRADFTTSRKIGERVYDVANDGRTPVKSVRKGKGVFLQKSALDKRNKYNEYVSNIRKAIEKMNSGKVKRTPVGAVRKRR